MCHTIKQPEINYAFPLQHLKQYFEKHHIHYEEKRQGNCVIIEIKAKRNAEIVRQKVLKLKEKN